MRSQRKHRNYLFVGVYFKKVNHAKINIIVQRISQIKYCTNNFVCSYNLDTHRKEYHPLDYSIVIIDSINHFKINDDAINRL